MAVNFSSGFNITSNEAVDQRIIKTKAEMRSMSPADLARMPDKYFCMCADDGQIYFYDKEGGFKPETGYFTAFDSTVADDIKNSEEVQSALTDNIVENIGENEGVQQSIASAISTSSDIQAQINQSVQDGLNSGTKLRELVNKVCMAKGINNINQIKMPLLIPAVNIYTEELYVFSNDFK